MKVQSADMNLSESPLFYASSLLFSDKDMEKLTNSVVGIAGIGGIGSIATEMIARAGVGSLKLADPDTYTKANLNRQLFATHSQLGKKKVRAAASRLKDINPEIELELFESGVNLSNIKAFCRQCDVIVCQPDKPSAAIIIFKVARSMQIPVVSGARPSFLSHRWAVCADVFDFKKDPDLACYGDNFPEIADASVDELTVEQLDRFDRWNHEKMAARFDDNLEKYPELFGSISQPGLLDRAKTCERHYNRHNCSVIANTSGCLAASAVLRLLLGGPRGKLEINLWEGNHES